MTRRLAEGSQLYKNIVYPQVTTQVTTQVAALLTRLNGEMHRQALQDVLGLGNREYFRKVLSILDLAAR